MTLYRHYKNLPYRLLKIVKHSETLEDLVLYETLYENERARFWVRPKAMFFENVEVDGKICPRFAKVEVRVDSSETLDPAMRSAISEVGRTAFPVWSEEEFDSRYGAYAQHHIAIAYIDDQPVAFKIGYALSSEVFYSWLGGVIPHYQRSGIATTLMEKQHEWASAKGYRSIRTKCLNHNPAMLILNSKHGFRVIETELTEHGLKLLLEKNLLEE